MIDKLSDLFILTVIFLPAILGFFAILGAGVYLFYLEVTKEPRFFKPLPSSLSSVDKARNSAIEESRQW